MLNVYVLMLMCKVSTNTVSLCTSVTLVGRLSGRGESSFQTMQALLSILSDEILPNRVRGRNLVVCDRGYLSEKLIEFLTSCGFCVLGTHQRVKSFPFAVEAADGGSPGLKEAFIGVSAMSVPRAST